MHRNFVYLSNKHLLKSIKSSLSFLICVLVLQFPTYGQCNGGIIINEFHYDNIGPDLNNFIEVAVPTNMIINLSNYVVSLYNGSDGMVYDFRTIDDFQLGMSDANYTYYIWKTVNFQQGPDGIALSHTSNLGGSALCEFISYEGAFMAVSGPAAGTMSNDIGVQESDVTTPATHSLQLINGVWTGPILNTAGSTNVSNASPEVVMISELSLCDRMIELQNVGINDVDVSNWRLCNFPSYATLSTTSVVSGSLLLSPGDFVTVRWNGMSLTAGEIGLYLPGGSFADPDNIVDYVQYNSINNTRAPVAVAADVWDDAALGITADASSLACVTTIANAISPYSSNSTTWCDAASPTIFPAGTNSACATQATCGVSFPWPTDINCLAFTAGIDNVNVTLKYQGIDPGAILVITLNGTTIVPNNGDDPATMLDGQISFTAQEGDSYVITFTDALCSSVSSSGVIPSNQCPTSLSCPMVGDLLVTEIMYNPSGVTPLSQWFEVCNTTATAIDMNGMDIADDAGSHTVSSSVVVPANGCIIISHGVLAVCGPANTAYQHNDLILNQIMDKVSISCNGTLIDDVAYSTGANFPSAGIGESISFNSAVSQDHVTNDAGTNWCLGTTACGANDLATPGMPNPACVQQTCGISFLASPTFICADNTAGIDMIKVYINYGGMDPDAVLVITVNSTIVPNIGNDPSMVANGTIAFEAEEGATVTISFTDPLCSSLNDSFSIPANLCPGTSFCSASLYINGVATGNLLGNLPQGVQLCASTDIGNLSDYGLEIVNSGTGANGVDYVFPPDPLEAGECIWVASDGQAFASFFGFSPCYITQAIDVDGDDAVMLYCGADIIDQLGDPNCDPNAFPPGLGDCGIWEYENGWVFANDNVPNPVFDDSEWIYQQNGLANALTNATAIRPYPLPGDMCPDLLYPILTQCPDDYANGGLPNSQPPLTGFQDLNADFETDGEIMSNQVIGSINPDIAVDYDSGTSITLRPNFEVHSGVIFHAFIDGCGGI